MTAMPSSSAANQTAGRAEFHFWYFILNPITCKNESFNVQNKYTSIYVWVVSIGGWKLVFLVTEVFF